MAHPWLAQYPAGVPAGIDPAAYPSVVALLAESFDRHAARPAFRFMGRELSYERVDHLSRAFAAWLQGQGLVRGDRVAIMLPNVPQFPVAVAAILRAGLVVVNVNPLATPRDLEHQLKDSGAKAIIVLEHFAATLQQVLGSTPTRRIVIAAMGDLLGLLKGGVVNQVARKLKKMVPPFELPTAVRFNEAIAQGRSMAFVPPRVGPEDIALLQYTGGITGVSKGAVLLHRNLVANLLQMQAWYAPAFKRIGAAEQPVNVCAWPLHQIFGFSGNLLLGMMQGGCGILLPNPRDIPGVLKELAGQRIHSFPAVNALFHALASHTDFAELDCSALVLCMGGGMAVQPATARLWLKLTGCALCEGYGLSEASPLVSCSPVDSTAFTGGIGVPLPGTVMKIIDDEGRSLPPGQPGEIVVQGPQVMAGYWQRPDETARVMMADGFLRTGDMGVMDERGRFRLVDRKKDLIVVGGLTIVPNELEERVAAMPGVLEVAAVGVPDAGTDEAVKLVVVRKDPALTEADVRRFCETHLAGYQRPKIVEFRTELPRTSVGKLLRRDLRA
ncbi:MAG: AMP-binding protein [Rubrivivax sp.]|nr:AMP-binding protein [Rubrivivax sp.]